MKQSNNHWNTIVAEVRGIGARAGQFVGIAGRGKVKNTVAFAGNWIMPDAGSRPFQELGSVTGISGRSRQLGPMSG
jgi:hypothetical protein